MAEECSSKSTCGKSSCEGCSSNSNGANNDPKRFQVAMNAESNIKKVIGIISGKGGVGKSFVTASFANQLAEQGFKVGILDADITGPSIPKMYGLKEAASASEQGIVPAVAGNGIKVMSVNLILPNAEDPVIWRGPVLAGVVKQFWSDVIWGDLDFLLVDMPPGTGDVPLTVFQSLPVDGAVVVTSPQELVKMIVKKSVKMAQMMNIPVLGVVENFSAIVCPDCGKVFSIFGDSKIEEVASDYQLPVLGKVPVNQEYAKAADEGRFHEVSNKYLKNLLG